MLDAVVDYLPSPLDIPPVKGIDPKSGQEVSREATVAAPFCALAFKVALTLMWANDLLRVYSGRVKAGSTLINSGKNRRERITKLFEDACQPSRGDSGAGR